MLPMMWPIRCHPSVLRASTLRHNSQRGLSLPATPCLSTLPRASERLQSVLSKPNHVERHCRFRHGDRRSVPILSNGPSQRRYKSSAVDSSQNPLRGLWKPTHLQRLYYGPNSVKEYLLECLPTETSKAFVLTGTSLANKTSLIKQVEEQLGKRHASTFSRIGQHAPVKELDEATELVMKDETIDTIISVGGGSPIDSAKAISYRLNEKKKGKFLYHITIPTTLSAAECTLGAGYTNEDGMKTGRGREKVVDGWGLLT